MWPGFFSNAQTSSEVLAACDARSTPASKTKATTPRTIPCTGSAAFRIEASSLPGKDAAGEMRVMGQAGRLSGKRRLH